MYAEAIVTFMLPFLETPPFFFPTLKKQQKEAVLQSAFNSDTQISTTYNHLVCFFQKHPTNWQEALFSFYPSPATREPFSFFSLNLKQKYYRLMSAPTYTCTQKDMHRCRCAIPVGMPSFVFFTKKNYLLKEVCGVVFEGREVQRGGLISPDG